MFDIVITSAPGTPFAGRIAMVLREARMRVILCEVSARRPPPDALRVDAAVACAPSSTAMLDIARSVRAIMDGPPPIIGVSSGAPMSSSRELSQTLPEDVSNTTLAHYVQRTAAQAERRRSKVVLQGDLDDVALDDLLASLASRNKSCFVRVRSGGRRAELTLDGGQLIHMRADGIDPTNRAAALAELSTWQGGSFEVVTSEEAAAPRSTQEAPRSLNLAASGASDVALAAAIVNACAAYARSWMGAPLTANLLASSCARVLVRCPGLEAFTISRDGLVSVTQVDRAKLAIPRGVAEWIVSFFDAAAEHHPNRFQRSQIRDVLGGLMRMVEQIGWASALFEGEAR